MKTHIEEYGGDPEFIVVTGGSAGGHLSLLAGLTAGHADWQAGFEGADTAVQGVLAMYPVVDLTNRHGIRQQASMGWIHQPKDHPADPRGGTTGVRGWLTHLLDPS